MGVSKKYKSVDELPSLDEKVYKVDSKTKEVTEYGNVDELPDLFSEEEPQPTQRDLQMATEKVGTTAVEPLPKKGIEPPIVEEEETVELGTPLDLIYKSKELGEKQIRTDAQGGAAGQINTPTYAEDKVAKEQSKKIKKQLYDVGIDADKIYNLIEGAEFSDESKANINKMLQENPKKAERVLANKTWKTPIKNKLSAELQKYTELGDANKVAELQNDLSVIDGTPQGTTYEENRNFIKTLAPTIRKYSDNPEKDIQKLATETRIVYGSQLLFNKDIASEDRKAIGLNDNQSVALDYLEDVNPSLYQAYRGVLTPITKEYANDYEFQLGREEKLKRLEEIGLQLKNDAAVEELNNSLQSTEPDALEYYDTIKTKLDEIETESGLLQEKYTRSELNDRELFADELLGFDNTFLGRAANVLGKATYGTIRSAYDIATAPFMSDEQSQRHLMKILGEEKLGRQMTNLPQSEQMIQSFKPKLSDKLKSEIEIIKQSKLSDKDKRDKVLDLLRDNPKEWERQPIDPTSNVSMKSMLYGVSDLAATLVPFIAGNIALGGGASASGFRKFVGEFGAAAMTMYNDALAAAQEQGSPNPYATAFRNTAINAFTMAGAGTASQIRKMALGSKNVAIRDMIGKMTDDEITKALRYAPKEMGRMQKAIQGAKNLAELTKNSVATAARVTPLMMSGGIINQAIDNGEIDGGHTVKEIALETLKFSVFNMLVGGRALMNKPNEITKTALFEAAANPTEFRRILDRKLEERSIDKTEYEQINNNISNAESILKTTPLVNGKGQPLNDKDARDLLFLRLQEKDLTDVLSKNIPKELADKVGKRIEGIHEKMDEVYKGTYLSKVPEQKTAAIESETKLPEPPKIEGEPEKITTPIESSVKVYEYKGKKYEVTDNSIIEVGTDLAKPLDFKEEVESKGILVEQSPTVSSEEVKGSGVVVEFTAYRFGEKGKEGVTFSSKNKDYSEEYATVKGGKAEDVKKVTVKAKNPITIDLSPKEFSSPSAEKKYIDEAKENGNDLVIFRDKENGDEFYAQIEQSATLKETTKAETPTPKGNTSNEGGDYYIKDGKEFKKVDNAKPVKLDTEGDFFAVKNDNGGYTIHEAKSGVAIDANSFHKTIKDAVNNANEKISKNSETLPLSRVIDGEIKRDGLSPRYSQSPKENTAVTDLLNEVNSGKINADDAAIKLDESGVEVSNEVYDQFREAEANFKKGKNGLQVGDAVTVKGKNGNPDFKGNFRGITKEGKYVVIGENGYQNVYEKSDIVEQSLKETPKAGSVGVGGDVEFTAKGGNKVVDEKGEPIVIYHGTKAQFDEFDKNKRGTNTDNGLFGKGFYFTKNIKTAQDYGKNIKSVYLSIKNPFIINNFKTKSEMANHLGIDESILREGGTGIGVYDEFSGVFSDALKEKGYDGVITKYGEYVVFEPSQIKAAEQSLKEQPKENINDVVKATEIPIIDKNNKIVGGLNVTFRGEGGKHEGVGISRWGKGLYTTGSFETASGYAYDLGGKGRVIAYSDAKPKNPLKFNSEEEANKWVSDNSKEQGVSENEFRDNLSDYLTKQGYDGINIKKEGVNYYVKYAKKTIKEQTKEIDVDGNVKVKLFKIGDGGTKGVFEGKDGQLYKSIEPQEKVITDEGVVRQTIKDAVTDEYKILSELQDNKHIPKVGKIVNTTEGKAFEIEKLDEVDNFTKEEYREIQKILNDLNDNGYHVGDMVTVMKRPKTGELVIVDFSSGYKGDRMSRDSEDYMQNISSKLSKSDAIQIRQEDMAAHNRDMAASLMKDEPTTEYYLTQRPPSIGTHPTEGLKTIEETEYRGRKVWKLTYDKKLSADQIYKFELTPKITNKEFLGQKISGVYGKNIFYVTDIDYKQGKVTLVSELSGKEISKDISFKEFQKNINEGKYKVELSKENINDLGKRTALQSKKKKKASEAAVMNRVEAKKTYDTLKKIDTPQDASGLAMKYFADGGKITPETLTDEVIGTRDERFRQSKNSKRISEERKDNDIVSPNGKSIKEIAHGIWDNLPEYVQDKVSTEDLRNELIDVALSYSKRIDIAKNLIDKYSTEKIGERSFEDKELEYFQSLYGDEIEMEEKAMREYDIERWIEEEEITQSDEYINHLINEYEKENSQQNNESSKGSEGQVNQKISNRESIEQAESKARLAQTEYDKAKSDLDKAEKEIASKQGTQAKLFGGTQKDIFGINADEAKSILDPLKTKVKEAKAKLDEAKNRVEIENNKQQELILPTNEKEAKEPTIKADEGIGKGDEFVTPKEDVVAKEDVGKDLPKAKEIRIEIFNKKADDVANNLKDLLIPKHMRDIKKSGVDLEKVIDTAIAIVKKANEAKENIQEAIEEAIKYIKTNFGDNWNDNLEQPLRDKFKELSTEKQDNKFVYSGSKETRVSGFMGRLMKAENVSEETKNSFKENGIEYQVASSIEAEKVAREVIDTFGTDDALRMAALSDLHPSVRSAIYAESINDFYTKEQEARKVGDSIAEIEYAKKWAEISEEYDKQLTSGGQFTSYAKHFYKKSKLGMKMQVENARKMQFDTFMKAREKDYKGVYEEMMKDPEMEALFSKEVSAKLKEERAKARTQRIAKVESAVDKAISMFKNSGATYSTVIPPQVIIGALNGIKIAYKAGEATAKIIQDAIDYISDKLGHDNWDKEKFRKEWEEKIETKQEAKTELERYKDSLKNQIKSLDEQIQSGEAKRKEKKQLELDDEAKELIEKRNQLKEAYKDKFGSEEKQLQMLDRLRRKMKGMTDEQKSEVIRKSFKHIIENDGLKYEDFKNIIAETLGLSKLTPEQSAKLETIVADINKVDELGKIAREKKTREALDNYINSKAKAEKAATELSNIINNNPKLLDRVISITQLNTLGIAALINNPVYNVWNQLSSRLPKAVLSTLMDKAIYGVSKMANKLWGTSVILPETNVLVSQKEFFNKLKSGSVKSIDQFRKGITTQDYLSKDVRTSQIKPGDSILDLWDYGRSSNVGNKIAKLFGLKPKTRETFLTKKQVVDKTLQSTVGVPAEIVARSLVVGDTPMRFAAEGAQAAMFAKNLGFTESLKRDLFIEFPREMAYEYYKSQGLSEAQAAKEADYVKSAIIREGEKSVFQQDNLFSSWIDSILSGKGGDVAKPIAFMAMPFRKIPLNAGWHVFNFIVPEMALLQSMVYGGKAAYNKFTGKEVNRDDIRNSKDWFAHAIVGVASMTAISYLTKSGILNPSSDDDETKKERQGEQQFGQQRGINITKLSELLNGGDPNKIKDGLVVDFRWFGNFGVIADFQARRYEDMTDEQRKNVGNFMNEIGDNMLPATKQVFNAGVFSGTSSILTSLERGNFDMVGGNLANLGFNFLHPAMFAQVSRAQLPYYSKAKADDFYGQLKNSLLTRSSTLRKLTGEYPPSKIGIWGDKLDKKDNTLMRMFSISKQNVDNFAQPIYNDYQRTGNTKFFPSAIKPEIKVNDKIVKLPTKEAEDLEIFVGERRKQLIAPYVNDGAKLEGINKKYSKIKDDETKIKALEIIYKMGFDLGKQDFVNKYPQYKSTKKDIEEVKEEKAERSSFKIFRRELKNK